MFCNAVKKAYVQTVENRISRCVTVHRAGFSRCSGIQVVGNSYGISFPVVGWVKFAVWERLAAAMGSASDRSQNG